MSRFYDALQKTRGTESATGATSAEATGPDTSRSRGRWGEVARIEGGAESIPGDAAAPGTQDSGAPVPEVLPLIHPSADIHAAYERMMQRLLAYRRSKRENVILVVSAVPQEGASTVARKLARALSQGEDERVLLVDANLRAPVQHAAFHTGPADGLTDVLRNEVPLSAAVKSGLGSGPALLAAGRPTEGPTQLLTQSAFHSVVSALKTEFDWVLIDGPPLTAYPDSASLAGASGGAVLVLQAERTRWEVAEEAKRVLESSGVDILGAVLNRRRYHIPAFIYRWL